MIRCFKNIQITNQAILKTNRYEENRCIYTFHTARAGCENS